MSRSFRIKPFPLLGNTYLQIRHVDFWGLGYTWGIASGYEQPPQICMPSCPWHSYLPLKHPSRSLVLRLKQRMQAHVNPSATFLDGLTSNGEPGILNRNAKKSSPPLQADVLMAFNHRQEALQQAAAAASNAGKDVVSMPGHELSRAPAMQSSNLALKIKYSSGFRVSALGYRNNLEQVAVATPGVASRRRSPRLAAAKNPRCLQKSSRVTKTSTANGESSLHWCATNMRFFCLGSSCCVVLRQVRQEGDFRHQRLAS